MCWQAARELEAECVRALWQLFVPGRLRANWCKQRSRGLLHESTCCRGVGFLPETLLGLHSNLFHVGKADLCAGSKLTKGPAWLPQMSSRSPSFILVCEVLRVFSWLSANACANIHPIEQPPLSSCVLVAANSLVLFRAEHSYFSPVYTDGDASISCLITPTFTARCCHFTALRPQSWVIHVVHFNQSSFNQFMQGSLFGHACCIRVCRM